MFAYCLEPSFTRVYKFEYGLEYTFMGENQDYDANKNSDKSAMHSLIRVFDVCILLGAKFDEGILV